MIYSPSSWLVPLTTLHLHYVTRLIWIESWSASNFSDIGYPFALFRKLLCNPTQQQPLTIPNLKPFVTATTPECTSETSWRYSLTARIRSLIELWVVPPVSAHLDGGVNEFRVETVHEPHKLAWQELELKLISSCSRASFLSSFIINLILK